MTPSWSTALLRPALELAVAVARAGEEMEPPAPAPRELRRLVNFARLPDRSLAPVRRVLDADPGFRTRVRELATEEGVGRAGWLFLDRPPGWEAELDGATAFAARAAKDVSETRAEDSARRRLAAVEEDRARLERALSGLRSEHDQLRSELAEERRARHRTDSDLGRLRHALAARELDLVESRRRLAAAQEAPAEPPQAEEASKSGGDDPGAAEGRLAVAAALEAAESAVSAAAEALRAAAGGVRDLVPPPRARPRPEPAPNPVAGRQPAPLPPAVFEGSVEAAEHLLRGSGVLVLVDGYNVTKLARPGLGLADQRRWLLDSAAALAARVGIEVQVVFDGDGERAQAPADTSRRTGVQARFSSAGVEADDLLLDLAAGVAPTRSVVVVSSDRRVQEGARALGASVVSSDHLVEVLRRSGRP